mmetsp:Transcript_1969/g.2531  ORF Transcript_1969/g.2531 Transcript_1969/m.2531 type:complete len:222 (-) Transcript_1969:46-711(-)
MRLLQGWTGRASLVGLGAGITYAGLYFSGHAPLWFGPERDHWSREGWSDKASDVLEGLEVDKEFYQYRPKASTRNFLEIHNSTEDRRIKKALFFNSKRKQLVAIVYFGADTEGPPRHVHGGCSAAVIDAVLGVCAHESTFLPCLTANLNINYRMKIPLGSTVQIICTLASFEGRKVKIDFKVVNLKRKDIVYIEGTSLFVATLNVLSIKNKNPPNVKPIDQ